MPEWVSFVVVFLIVLALWAFMRVVGGAMERRRARTWAQAMRELDPTWPDPDDERRRQRRLRRTHYGNPKGRRQ